MLIIHQERKEMNNVLSSRKEQQYWEEDGHFEDLPFGNIVITAADLNECDDEDDTEDEDVEFPVIDQQDEVEIGGDFTLENDCNLDDETVFGQEIELSHYMHSGPVRKRARTIASCLPRTLFQDQNE